MAHPSPQLKRATKSLTVVVTAYNEEKTLPKTLEAVAYALRGVIADYEIVVIDDASRDNSFGTAKEWARRDSRIRVVRNKKNLNQGGCYRESVGLATKEFHVLLSGDNMIEKESLRKFFGATGKADLVLNVIENMNIRHPLRQVVSSLYVSLLNFLFRLRVKYYNGPVIVRTALLEGLPISGAFSFMAEVVIPLLKKGVSYVALPLRLTPHEKGANIRTLIRNFFPVASAITRLFWRVEVLRRFS